MNGVTHSLVQVVHHLETLGHELLVIAPRSAGEVDGAGLPGSEVELLRSVGLPTYPEVRLVFASARRIAGILAEFEPDVVHLAAPFVLGWQALRAADTLGIPTVAIYQTDIPGYAHRYGISAATPALSQHLTRIHRRATLTLAPSSAALDELAVLGIDRLRLWARGVDAERFSPSRRSAEWRTRMAPNDEVVIGYVGRLAPEKQVDDLRALVGIPGTRLVIVGDGPSRHDLEEVLPEAAFLGFQSGLELAESLASFDLFVHPGENETFCQTVQEALASGVPVVATGRGGPVDLVQSSRTGWLYRPGDRADLRARVIDLVGDGVKRSAFGLAARESVAHRTWASLGDELLVHYDDAINNRIARARGPRAAGVSAIHPTRSRYVAIGDSITEGMGDSSRQAPGTYRGWADRLAMLLAHAGDRSEPLLYANLAVRGRTLHDVVERQIPQALALRPDFVTILIGGNDLARRGTSPARLADRLARGVARLRAAGVDVLLVTPFIPSRPFLGALNGLTREFALELRAVAEDSGCRFLDITSDPASLDERSWAADRVHLSSRGHRALAYRAAEMLGVPGAHELGLLDRAVHDEPGPPLVDIDLEPVALSTPAWLWQHVRPWAGRRLRGRTSGDGLDPKHAELVPVVPSDPTGAPTRVD
jgi:phosphatidylinositol alpha 1,6-mannosyltransferase